MFLYEFTHAKNELWYAELKKKAENKKEREIRKPKNMPNGRTLTTNDDPYNSASKILILLIFATSKSSLEM